MRTTYDLPTINQNRNPVVVFDAGEKYPYDRYTAVYKGKDFTFRRRNDDRQWHIACCGSSIGWGHATEICLSEGGLGKRVPFESLPEDVRTSI